MVKNDSLITYEKAFLGQAAVKKFFIATFLERKIMSTKTSFKRIALVAASALALGGFSVISAPQASAAVSVAYSNTYDTTNGYGVAGGTATVTITLDTSTIYTIASTGVGSVLSSTTSTNAVHTSPAAASEPGVIYSPTTWYDTVSGSGTGVDTLLITSPVAGVQTITITPITAGTPGTATVKNFTWTSSSSTAISAEKSLFGIVDASGNCTISASASNDEANLAANAESSGSYRATTTALMVPCLLVRDGNGNAVTSLTSQVWSITGGSLASGSLSRAVTTSTSGSDGSYYNSIYGDNIAAIKGATITVTAIKSSASFTKTATFDLYGKIASVALTAAATSLNPGTAGADYNTVGSEAATTALAYMVCKDKNDVKVTKCDYDGDASFGTGDDGSNFYITGDSDKVAGAPTFVASAAATAVQAGGIVPTFVLDDATAVGAEKTWLQINNSSLLTAAQKVTYTVYAKNAAETTPTASIKSNSWDFYTSGALSKITVTPAVTSGATNELTTVNVSAVDANGYPAEDGTSVSLLASNGGSIAPQTKTLAAGVFATAAALVLGNGDTTVTAVSGSKSGSAVVSVSGGSGESASLALDAANAATDAANNAYDEAQNATQAASDALAAVTALAAQVKSLIASVKKLTSAVAKLKK